MSFQDQFVNAHNQYKIQALFIDSNTGANIENSKNNAIYTIANQDRTIDGVDYPSLKKLYLELEDLEEYTFATTYLKDWQHWEALCRSKWFRPHADQWRFELTKKMNSRALLSISKMARDVDDKNYIQANRILLQKTEEIKASNVEEQKTKTKGAGRPKKEPQVIDHTDKVTDDYDRIFNNG